MVRRLVSTICCLSILTSSSFASIDSLLDSMVYGVSYQGANTIKSPTRTTYTLGSLSFRLRNDLLDQPIFSLSPPRATLSCSGADFDAGWLSIMNLDTFANLIQQAGTQFMWGIVVGIAYSLPGIGTAFDWIQKWGRMVQQLAGNMCNIGISVGKNIGSALFEAKKTEAAENAVGSGAYSAFTEAFKAFRDFFDMAGFYGAYPVDALEKAGWADDEVRKLIATATGIVVWFPADENGNICTNRSCIKSGENVRFFFYEPNPTVLDQIIHGGTVQVYDCNYQVYAGGWGTCANGRVNVTNIYTAGLSAKIFERLRSVRDKILGGGWNGAASDPDTQFVASMSYFYPNISRVLNAAALLYRKGYQGLSDNVLVAYSDMLSVYLIDSFIKSMRNRLVSLKGLYALNKSLPQEISKAIAGADKSASVLEDYLEKTYKEVKRMTEDVNRTLAVESIVNEAALDVFGRSAALYLR